MAIGTGGTFVDDITEIFGLTKPEAKMAKVKEFADQSMERQILGLGKPVGHEGTIDTRGYRISYRIPRSSDVTLTSIEKL